MTQSPSSGLLDFCPRCRIQAPHRPGRDTCPRCDGPLSVIAPGSAANRAPQPTPMRARQAQRPSPKPARQRVFRNPNMRWTAQRPPQARPAPRRAPSVDGPGRSPIPRYAYIPRWGLPNLDPEWRSSVEDARVNSDRQLTQALTLTSVVFTLTALIHLVRYVLVSVNRSVVIPSWVDRVTALLVIFAGACAALAVLLAIIAVAQWLKNLRADVYRGIGRLDPRPWWQLWPLVVVPIVNLIGPAWLLYEVADIDVDAETFARRQRRMTRILVAWVIVNILAAVAITYQFVADSIQNQADGLFFVVVSAAVSAAFSWWYRLRLPGVFDAPVTTVAETKTRWVIAG
ncbi:DUF4328 domain-containing protein [Gordonia sp. CPCC 205333]|uniref:DUF4328 domain-containing protein n=1 Tax=Gordonia sp. CPCC 205333 TaxID=3140790 RepID=UPI003AF3D386